MGRRVQAPSLPEVGTKIGDKLRLESLLGEGGGGVVYAAQNLQLKQRVAVKVLRPAMMEAPDGVARFVREAQSAAAIESEHCVRTTDFGTLPNGLPYIVMEYLEGTDLKRRLASDGPLSATDAVDLALQACEALAEAHRRGIVHRDLKPANLFLTSRSDGSMRVKVLDFGIAKLLPTEGGEAIGLTGDDVLGTAIYMSPEQLREGATVDERTDVWALGLTLYEALTGARPFPGGSSAQVAAAIVSDPPIPLRDVAASVPEGLAQVVHKCISKEPTRRFASIAELAAALEPFASIEGSSSARRARANARGPRVVRRDASAPPPSKTMDDSTLGAAPSSVAPRRESSRSWVAFALAGVLVAGLAFAVGRLRSEPASTAVATASATSTSTPTASTVPTSVPIAIASVPAAPSTSSAPAAHPSARPIGSQRPDLVHDPSLLSRE